MLSAFVLLGGLVLSSTLSAQTPPPIGGLTGTVALEGTVQQEDTAANTVIVKTKDGVDHLFHFTNVLIHGGKDTDTSALRGLREGSSVVVHYTVAGGDSSAQEIDRVGEEGLKITEGVVNHINRRKKQIVVRFDNGKTQRFELTERATADAGKDLDREGATKVVIYYSDEGGRKVAHYFRKTP